MVLPKNPSDCPEKAETPAGFALKLKKREKWYWWGLKRFLAVLVLWGGTHVTLNAGAYWQIWEFRLSEVQKVVEAMAFSEKTAIKESKEPKMVQNEAKSLQTATITPKIVKKKAKKEKKEQKEPIFTQKLQNSAQKTFLGMPVYPSDNRIVLPRLGKNIPLISVSGNTDFDVLEENMQEALRNGVAIHPVSRPPTQNGNFFLTGHSSYYTWDDGRFKDVFALLHEVNQGDEIQVFWDGKMHEYEIFGQRVVDPTEVSVLAQPNDEKLLTLMTCTPIGTAEKRLVLTARPKASAKKARGIKRKK